MKTIYKSELKELADKEFESMEACEAEEAKVNEAVKAKEEALAEKKADLAKINEAANYYLKLVADNNEKRNELREAEDKAYADYKKELNAFAEKNQGYHLTYKLDGNNVEFKIEEAKQKTIQEDLDEVRKAFRQIFSNFWF